MQGKGFIKFIFIALVISALYSLSFTAIKYYIEKDAFEVNNGDIEKTKRYLDSLETVDVIDIGFIKLNYASIKEKAIPLGLDLKGGMSVTMDISLIELLKNLSDNSEDEAFNQALSSAEKRMASSDSDFITLFYEEIQKTVPNVELAQYFAIEENQSYIQFDSTNQEVIAFLRTEAKDAIDRSFNILRTRIDKFGVTSPNIQLQGATNRILIELPGVSDPRRVRKLLQGSAKLEFWNTFSNHAVFNTLNLVNQTLQKSLGLTVTANDNATEEEKNQETFEVENPLFKYLNPAVYTDNNNQVQLINGPVIGYTLQRDTALVNAYLRRPEVKEILPEQLVFRWGVKPEETSKIFELFALRAVDGITGPALEGDVISNARADFGQTGKPEVVMVMNAIGARQWKDITAAAVANGSGREAVAIVLDDAVYSAPVVQNEISNGVSSISGQFEIEETKDLANVLKAGRLPAPARIVEESIVGPSLGKESIASGLYSSVFGLLLVLLFMIFYYNTGGYAANVAVFTNMFFLMGALASIGAVLTLPGIAGIVLTIGMAVDANVLIYERIREALKAGKPIRVSISEGYKMAMSSILDSNITTFLTGVVLYVFGTGPILGFATTLMIGILSSLFTSIFISRLIFERLLRKKRNIKFSISVTAGTLVNSNFNFIKKRVTFYMISGFIILAGIISIFTKGFTMGVEFEGGRSFLVRYEQSIEAEKIRSKFSETIDAPVQIKSFGSDNQYKITTSYLIDDKSEEADIRVEEDIEKVITAYEDNLGEVISSQKVGPTIADDIKQSAVYSIIFLVIIISLYLLFRFGKWHYSLGAMIALLHDILFILSIFSIFDGILPFSLDIDQAFIAGILTVVGYSINDTVVVFDRLREYLTNKLHINDPLDKVINFAVNKTLSRTIITSLTLIFALLVLFVFGGDTIRGFSFSLLLGAIVGTYSSIFIAAPIIYEFGKKKQQ